MLNFMGVYKWPIAIAAFLLFTVLMLFSGWQIRTYYDGYQQNIAEQVQKTVDTGIRNYQQTQAKGLEDTKNLLDNARVNTIIKEPTIINRPIYMQQCMDQAGVDLLKQYKLDSKAAIEGTKK